MEWVEGKYVVYLHDYYKHTQPCLSHFTLHTQYHKSNVIFLANYVAIINNKKAKKKKKKKENNYNIAWLLKDKAVRLELLFRFKLLFRL